MKPFWQQVKNENKRLKTRDVRNSAGSTKEKYQHEKELLNCKLQTLISNAHVYKIAATQTVLSGGIANDMNCKSPITEDRILNLLKNQDSQLADRISDLVQQKLAIQKTAEADLQQLQEKMKDEKHAAVKLVKDAHKNHLEKLKHSHKMQLKQVEYQHEMQLERLRNRIIRLQNDEKMLKESMDNCDNELRNSKADNIKLQAENRMLSDENRTLRRGLAEKREMNEKLDKSAFLIGELREKLRNSEEAKELILQQFRLLELERDDLLEAIQDGINEVNKVNRLDDKILETEIARTEGKFLKQKRGS